MKEIDKKPKSKAIKFSIYAVIILVVIGVCYFLLASSGLIKTFKLAMQLQQEQEQQQLDADVLAKLSSIMLLPKDVTPTMAVINDIEALKAEQPGFFNDAKNGDRVILYPEMAVIYDYQANKIIHVGPVLLQTDEQAALDTNSELNPTENVPMN